MKYATMSTTKMNGKPLSFSQDSTAIARYWTQELTESEKLQVIAENNRRGLQSLVDERNRELARKRNGRHQVNGDVKC